MSWDIDSDKPIFKQLMDIIKSKIISGEYKSGEKLPSVRELASIAKVNPNTMQKALSELESTNLIFTQRTNGRFVTDDKDLIEEFRKKQLELLVKNSLKEATKLGLSHDYILNAVKKAIKELEDK